MSFDNTWPRRSEPFYHGKRLIKESKGIVALNKWSNASAYTALSWSFIQFEKNSSSVRLSAFLTIPWNVQIFSGFTTQLLFSTVIKMYFCLRRWFHNRHHHLSAVDPRLLLPSGSHVRAERGWKGCSIRRTWPCHVYLLISTCSLIVKRFMS